MSGSQRARRARLEGWLDEQVRAAKPEKGKKNELHDRFYRQAVLEAAHTLLNRLVFVRILEHHNLLAEHAPLVVTGAWKSPGYVNEFFGYAGPLADDDSRGLRVLLDAIYAELSLDLPGLFGDVGLTALFPVPASTLRAVLDVLNDPALAIVWGDDTTLGWVYQYWNDPERESLDAKIAAGGKIEPYEIASKTQMFTERYMVEWLLQNSLGLTWLAMCKKNGWTADAERALPELDARRAEWRQRRERGEVAADALMPIVGELEERWKYFVPQPLPDDAVTKAPDSIRELKLLDPACGSGHFLVIAFDLLAAMHREEGVHRGQVMTDREIAEAVLEHNLHGIDIDPRAIQIAAAALHLKAKTYAKGARPRTVNLVAPVLKLGDLPADDPAIGVLCKDLKDEVGLAEELTRRLVGALAGVDYLGSLLKVDAAVDEALRQVDLEFVRAGGQGHLFGGFPMQQVKLTAGQAKATVLGKLEAFLARHSGSEDLGLRLDGEQLAAGVRFVRLAKEGAYDVVVGNPPYQGLSKTNAFGYVATAYTKGKADLYTAFLERGLQFAREGGVSAMVTMRGWMFLNQFRELREDLLRHYDLRNVVDLDSGAFEEVSAAQVVLSVACSVFVRCPPDNSAIALRPTPTADKASAGMTSRKRAGLLAQVGRYEFYPRGFAVIEGEPIVYWWSKDFLAKYAAAPKLGDVTPARFGLTTGDNVRFVRLHHEVDTKRVRLPWGTPIEELRNREWTPFVLGGKGRAWVEPLREVCRWRGNGLEVKEKCVAQYGTVSKQVRNEDVYFKFGIAFAMIGTNFSGRIHRYPSVIGNMGSSVFPESEIASTLALMNGAAAKFVLQSINPGLHFEVGDVNRLAILPTPDAVVVMERVVAAFAEHEATREPSVEFKKPGESGWLSVQSWAQRAVDRSEGAPLPLWEPTYEEPVAEAHISFAVGIALGRFGADGEGILDAAPKTALHAGILFVGPGDGHPDCLAEPAATPIHAAWNAFTPAEGKKPPLRDYLRKDFFAFHKWLYENRPIYFPLSSEKKNFVAWISIHRWNDSTLQTLLADHLNPVLRQLDAEIRDATAARGTADKKAAIAAAKAHDGAKRLRDDLVEFITRIEEIAERGAPTADAGSAGRDVDAPFVMDLDDGVMINGAALWPLLAPQWNDPKRWWKQLCAPSGKKDYDWAHLAKRYFPTRVEAKCAEDPSLAVAHGCFWRLHPAKAYAWELRLQDEIRADFTIDEADSDKQRAAFVRDHATTAEELRAKETKRRQRKGAKEEDVQGDLDLEDDDDDE